MTLLQSLNNYNDDLEKVTPTYSGLLGLAIGGSRKVNVPNRAGFVYVRLRDNLSEVVQVYNDKVSPIYDLPVIIHRKHNRWFVLSKDDGRYENWGTNSPYLPRHGTQHSLNRDTNSGGDVVFVYPDQFMPLLVYPSGTAGAGMVWVAPYLLQRENDFVYVGNTGTVNLLQYRPTDDQAILGLVCLNRTTGNPEVLIASGTPASATQTGTSYISGYLPYPESHQEPLYAVRLVSGTTAVKWENLYNARQLFGGSGGSIVTGSSGGNPAGSDGDIQYNDDGDFGASTHFRRESNGTISIGVPSPHLLVPPFSINQGSPTGSAIHYQWTFGNENAYSRLIGYHAGGTVESSLATPANYILHGFIGRGFWGADSPNPVGAEIRVVATENHTENAYGSHFEFWPIPTGTSTRTKVATVGAGGINLESGMDFTRDGDTVSRQTLSANRTYYVRTDGNNSNSGLENNSGGAFLTIQKAVDVVSSIDPNGYNVTIQVANGTYAENVTLGNTLGDLVTITGNTGSPSSVVTSQFFKSGSGTIWHIEGFRFTASSATRALLSEVGALITFSDCNFGAGYTYQIESLFGAGVRATGNYSISSGANAHISVRGNSFVRIQSITVTLTGTPAFGTTSTLAFIEARYGSTTFINNNTFSGSATGRRYYVDLNAVVQSAGATLPGNAAGATATGGIYA